MTQKPKSVALITIHGMGNTPVNYHQVFLERIKQHIGKAGWQEVAFESVYYQDILQAGEEEIYKEMKPHVRWRAIRQFILYGFSDATGLDDRKEKEQSAYHKVQLRIWASLQNVYNVCGRRPVPIVMLAYSLGSHLISNYIWDAQQSKPYTGVWQFENRSHMDGNEQNFLRLKSLTNLFTIGCNIPIFVASHKNIQPFAKPNKNFKWLNLYDKDDLLGWPLEPLSESYRKLVKDVPINASETFLDFILKSWNPFSHEKYFGSQAVVQSVGEAVNSYLNK